MNFLAHYFLDRNHPSSFFVVGAATPDLLSIYNEKFRVKRHHLQAIEGQDLEDSAQFLIQGIQRHFEADEAFHTSSFFNEKTDFINRELKERFITASNQRKFFIAHVLLELVLDKVLIENNPGIIAEYYQHYSKVFPFQEVKQATSKVTSHPLPNYEHFLEKFLHNRYLTHYTEWDHIVFVLGRILRRAGVIHPDFLESKPFLHFLDAVQKEVEKSYLDPFKILPRL